MPVFTDDHGMKHIRKDNPIAEGRFNEQRQTLKPLLYDLNTTAGAWIDNPTKENDNALLNALEQVRQWLDA